MSALFLDYSMWRLAVQQCKARLTVPGFGPIVGPKLGPRHRSAVQSLRTNWLRFSQYIFGIN